ncbi:interleukin-15 receptor subunit alpha isoform X3 [Chelmon rostratus]|uniref:interleukin-15 receptor subunit alpha isoform X3 n=1 Tax=Chelmon rostratus TaxID=109905 RepID=UPI001BE62A7E|nr:interleukin-15 receptor subunit alpha isoform X3 [Chelmon rostratus]
MDPGYALFSVGIMMICLLGAARCSKGDGIDCPCPKIPPRNLTEPPPTTCFQINSTFRYTCIGGYVRKAGTSDLTKCKQIRGVAEWKVPSLQCISDPKRTTTQTPTTTATEGHTDIPHESIITTTVTSTSLQMTQSISTSASVTAGVGSTEPTSPGLQVPSDHSQADSVRQSKATSSTTSTSTTAEPSNGSTANPQKSDPKLSSTSIAMIAFASLVIICALIGISFVCYRRRLKNIIPQHAAEELILMNQVPAGPAS